MKIQHLPNTAKILVQVAKCRCGCTCTHAHYYKVELGRPELVKIGVVLIAPFGSEGYN